MEIMRLVVTGPVGAGKSTFIRTISEIEVVDTDREATDEETKSLKKRTTVAFDFGRLQFSPDMALHLYGTPGQSRFDFMWDILIRKAHAYMLLIPANRPQEFRYARRILNFMSHRTDIPMIIGLTHMDCSNAWNLENIGIAIGYPEESTRPIMVPVNANEKESVINAVITLVQQLMEAALVS
jgi:hypothetical protein